MPPQIEYVHFQSSLAHPASLLRSQQEEDTRSTGPEVVVEKFKTHLQPVLGCKDRCVWFAV